MCPHAARVMMSLRARSHAELTIPRSFVTGRRRHHTAAHGRRPIRVHAGGRVPDVRRRRRRPVRQLRHRLGRSPTPPPRAVWYALPSVHAERLLVFGACKPDTIARCRVSRCGTCAGSDPSLNRVCVGPDFALFDYNAGQTICNSEAFAEIATQTECTGNFSIMGPSRFSLIILGSIYAYHPTHQVGPYAPPCILHARVVRVLTGACNPPASRLQAPPRRRTA